MKLKWKAALGATVELVAGAVLGVLMPDDIISAIASRLSLEPIELVIVVLAVLFVFFLTWAIWDDRSKLLAIAGGLRSRRRAGMSDYEQRRQKFKSGSTRKLLDDCARMLQAYPTGVVDEAEMDATLDATLTLLGELRIYVPPCALENDQQRWRLREFMDKVRSFSGFDRGYEYAAQYAEGKRH